ncbi:F-box domain-containing protein [Heracleum sosnowskyi]|uniref:F-box domain-containing protein n=1 Tax=Heracleum sosnowskyi TaxID=360622 RepID=A0AAD8IL34_9APIA|nr:F-box domain-containing protein [Heracleum sosnowskyi]
MGKKQNAGGERLKEEDLLIEVLSRLDVRTLLVCKAVSKTWHSLISSPTLVKCHLSRAITSSSSEDNKKTALIVRLFNNEEDSSFSLYQLGGCDDNVAHLDFPYSTGDYPCAPPSFLIGCVCGIVCVSVIVNFRWFTTEKRTDIYIWNPATKQSKLVPGHTLDNGKRNAALGFGFDPIDFDFKVVRVLSKDTFPEVYSLNKNVWRNIETRLSDIPYRHRIETCLHGFLFAIGHNGMMAFDLNKEVFICDISLPVRSNDTCVADFKDSVAVIIFNFSEKVDRIKLWSLDDEACLRGVGVEASWTMMLTIDVGVRVDWVFGIFNSVELLLASGDLFLYNLNKKVGRYIDTDLFFDFHEVFKYTETLLPVPGSKLVNWSDDVDDNEESSTDLEEVSEESRIDSEDDDERSSVGVGSEDGNEECTGDSEDDDDSEEKSSDSGDE